MSNRDTIMECGHAANSRDMNTHMPICAICIGINPGATIINSNPPNLNGRLAQCDCGRTEPSDSLRPLAYFEYRGEGSPRGIYEYDRYYCGHAGWD